MSNQQLTVDKAPISGASITTVSKVGEEPVVLRDGYKRVFDLTLILLAHVLLFPLWILLWIVIPLAIWLGDRGPIFYTQERVGRLGKRFKVVKFRTMIQNAEARTGPVWATNDDERVTNVGGLLRKLRLDEMPQVINILMGEMSLVGPRPERPFLIEQFSREVPGFSQRLRVKPGVAGLAQVRGHYSTSPRYKLKYDKLYIETLSPWMDVRLLFLSVWVVLRRIFNRSSN
jgi:lipopolysaccharide/colanic/teichoic acid biosynthesis glycosyltransferase